MTFTRSRRVVAALVAGSCLALPASASADPLPSTHKSDAAQAGYAGMPAASPPASLPSTHKSDAAQAGYAGGATRAAATQPTTIEVERTIVRDVNEALPLILSSTALLLVLAGLGVVLIRTRMAPRAGR
jgi:hypothetical protein